MSTTVTISLSAEARALLAASRSWTPAMLAAIARTQDLENELTIGHAQARKLSRRGPTTLGVVTNRLRSSLSRSPAVIVGQSVGSAIGTNVGYAGAHEFGFSGPVAVRQHTRQVSVYAGGRRQVAVLQKSGRIAKQRAKVLAQSSVTVRAHTRQMKLPARSFIRASLAERSADYGRALSLAVVTALRNPPSA